MRAAEEECTVATRVTVKIDECRETRSTLKIRQQPSKVKDRYVPDDALS